MVIIHAVPGGDVDEAGACGVVHEVVAFEKLRGLVDKRMAIFESADGVALERFNLVKFFPAARLCHFRQQRALDENHLPIHTHLGIGKAGVKRHGEVGGKRPWRGGPDEQVRVFLAGDRKLHEHTLADVVGILHLCLRQRGAARDAPVNGLLAAIHKALLDHISK